MALPRVAASLPLTAHLAAPRSQVPVELAQCQVLFAAVAVAVPAVVFALAEAALTVVGDGFCSL